MLSGVAAAYFAEPRLEPVLYALAFGTLVQDSFFRRAVPDEIYGFNEEFLSGNVAEWVNDFYAVPTPGQTRPVVDPLGPERGRTRVIRGSSWKHGGQELRLSYRDHDDSARPDVGFRIARNLDE